MNRNESKLQSRNTVNMAKELKSNKTLEENLIPRKSKTDIEKQIVEYNEDSEEYFVEQSSSITNEGDSDSDLSPNINRMLKYPMYNFTRFKDLPEMENVFYTDENLLLLEPESPTLQSKPFVADKVNPKLENIIKAALRDLENAVVINCDHQMNKFRRPKSEAPSYTAVGPNILLRSIPSEKYIDFSCVPSDVILPSGLDISRMEIPSTGPNGQKFTHEQLLAFPLAAATLSGELIFDSNLMTSNKLPSQTPKKNLCSSSSPQIKASSRVNLKTASPQPKVPRSVLTTTASTLEKVQLPAPIHETVEEEDFFPSNVLRPPTRPCSKRLGGFRGDDDNMNRYS